MADRGIIYPAGIVSVWTDVQNAVERYERSSRLRLDTHDEEEELALKWQNLQDAILNYKAKAR